MVVSPDAEFIRLLKSGPQLQESPKP
jgi:hypothetical protein